jgi:hypothetical protein
MRKSSWLFLIVLGWPLLKVLYYFATRFEVSAPLGELDLIIFVLGLLLSFSMLAVIKAAKKPKVPGSFSLSWKRFAVVAIFLIALPLFFLYVNSRTGGIDITDAGIPLASLSTLALFGFRWLRMRRDFANGRFTEADFRSNPLPLFVGRPLYAILWFCFTLFLIFLPLGWWAYHHWPKA